MVRTMIWATSGPPESESFRWRRERTVSVASQTSQPASNGTAAHQRLRVAPSMTRPIRSIPTKARRRPSISIDVKPSASNTGGPQTAGVPS